MYIVHKVTDAEVDAAKTRLKNHLYQQARAVSASFNLQLSGQRGEGCTALIIMHCRSRMNVRPSHPYNVGTEHVGFSRTRQKRGRF